MPLQEHTIIAQKFSSSANHDTVWKQRLKPADQVQQKGAVEQIKGCCEKNRIMLGHPRENIGHVFAPENFELMPFITSRFRFRAQIPGRQIGVRIGSQDGKKNDFAPRSNPTPMRCACSSCSGAMPACAGDRFYIAAHKSACHKPSAGLEM